MKQAKLVDAINELLKNNSAFVAFQQPKTTQPQLFAGGNFECLKSLSAISEKGFVFHPFYAGDEKAYFYKPQFVRSGWEIDFGLEELYSYRNNPYKSDSLPFVVSKTEYLDQARTLISMLKNGVAQKVVLSRVIPHKLEEQINWGNKFEQLCQKYLTAFVYILSDGQGLFWAGATPETLISVKDRKAYTMALAGTQPAKLHPEETYVWQQKEWDEQQYVTDYIAGILQDAGIENIEISEKSTQLAGKLVHLVNHIDFEMPAHVTALELAQKIHPTPAICGFPADKSFELIRTTERHKRSFYSGFLGLIHDAKAAEFYVNLRCIRLIDNVIYSYVGGGLTADSIPEKEWTETVLKSQTMLSLFTK